MVSYPCKGCDCRESGCHDHCLEYLTAKRVNADIRATKTKADNWQNYCMDRHVKIERRNRHRGGK